MMKDSNLKTGLTATFLIYAVTVDGSAAVVTLVTDVNEFRRQKILFSKC